MSKVSKKISIIVPIYNAEKYLEECIESLINQTLKEIEIILINDGSTDKSSIIIDGYKNIENITIIHKKNGGVSEARNLGLRLAIGEYILNVDSDDFIHPEMCEKLYKNAKDNNSDIVVSDIYSYFSDGNKKYVADLKIKDILSAEKYLEILFEENFLCYNFNKLIKRALFTDNNIEYDSNISMMEDTLALVKLIKNSKIISKENEAYYYYRKTESAVSQNVKFKHLSSVMAVSKEVKRELKDIDQLKEIINKRFITSLTQFIFNCEKINSLDKNDFEKLLKEYLDLFKVDYSRKKLANKNIELIVTIIEKIPLRLIVIFLRNLKLNLEKFKGR